jgi:DNA-binding MarR family transcriptional regulator
MELFSKNLFYYIPLLCVYSKMDMLFLGVAHLAFPLYDVVTVMNTTDMPTYQAVILQSRAQRAIKASLTSALRAHGITMMQWSIIGLIADAGKNGLRISDAAHSLDTSLAFITTSVNVLEAKGFVHRTGHVHDNRAKMVSINPEFMSKIADIEASLKNEQRQTVYKDIADSELASYFTALRHIARTA